MYDEVCYLIAECYSFNNQYQAKSNECPHAALTRPGARFDDGAGGDNEVQRTMLELINQLDGFDPRGNIKVLMATNRPDTLDPALMRPGRLDRKIEFSLPDLEVRRRGPRAA